MINIPKSFQNSQGIEAGLSDFHKNVFNFIESFRQQTETTYYSMLKL